jgi:hypothetical protein
VFLCHPMIGVRHCIDQRMKTTRINLDGGARVIAHNRCTQCGHEWQDKPTGFARHLFCSECGSDYWEWLNPDTEGGLSGNNGIC